MNSIMKSTAGLTILVNVNRDLILGLAAVGSALTAAAWLCSLSLH